jgi:hypothetical protein
MAQIQNTDALSWLNKKDLLNQAFVSLYDDLNSFGDMYFVRETCLSDGELPPDVFKLIFVGRFNGIDLIPLPRAPNSSPFSGGYRIINDKLQLPANVPLPVIIRYIPEPETITFPREGIMIPGKADQALYDAARDVLFLGTAEKITITDRRSGETYTVDVTDPYVMAVSNGILYVVTGSGIAKFDYTAEPLGTFLGTFDLYTHAIGWEDGIIVRKNGNYRRYGPEGLSVSPDYWNYDDGKIEREGDSFIYHDSLDRTQDITSFFYGAESIVIASPYIFVNRADGTIRGFYGLEEMEQEKREGRTQRGVVLACDPGESGYGVVFRDFQSGLWLKGYSENTLMDYPRNIFFDALVVDMAIRMRTSLDQATGELPAMLDDYRETLMKSISRDGFSPARIQNVYGGRING